LLGDEARLFVSIKQPRTVNKHLVAEPQAAAAARRQLEALWGELDRDELNITSLLTTELIANSVLHAETAERSVVRLRVEVTDETVRVEVCDEGAGFTPPDNWERDPTDGHWGLQLVDAMADRWDVTTGAGTAVWFEIDRASSATAASAATA
jgi:anti-sigma regulatory factor (Ser/Thr protein kinase)